MRAVFASVAVPTRDGVAQSPFGGLERAHSAAGVGTVTLRVTRDETEAAAHYRVNVLRCRGRVGEHVGDGFGVRPREHIPVVEDSAFDNRVGGHSHGTTSSASQASRPGERSLAAKASAIERMNERALQDRIRELENELAAERAFTRRYLDLGSNVFVLITSDERVHLINRAATELFGRTREEMVGQNWFDLAVPVHQREAQRRRFREIMGGSRELFRQLSESQIETASGDVRDMLWGVSILTNPSGRQVGQMMSGEDVTEERRAKQTIEHMAFHDQLTDLPNRAFLQRHLPTIIEQAAAQSWSVALLFMDFDNFKTCNDTYGHAAGDELLRQISYRLQSMIRPADTVVRLGGDEFVMVLPDLSSVRAEARQQATMIASRIREVFSQEFQLTPEILHRSGASVGIALAPFDTAGSDELLSHADSAMYHAKQHGKNRFAFWADMREPAPSAGPPALLPGEQDPTQPPRPRELHRRRRPEAE
jgi:diguanylate cyclase (GGDEF)-like protein/PAS domain S-box-containing protein